MEILDNGSNLFWRRLDKLITFFVSSVQSKRVWALSLNTNGLLKPQGWLRIILASIVICCLENSRDLISGRMKNICEQFSRANSVPGLLWLGVRQIAAQIVLGKNKFLMDGDNLSDMSLPWHNSSQSEASIVTREPIRLSPHACLSNGISVQVNY